jgi:kumamolisin
MNVPAGYQSLANSEHRPRRGAATAGPADPDEQITVSVVVRRRADAPPLPSHEHWMKTPPGQRRFLSRAEFAARFGAESADLDRVADFGRASGLTVVESSAAKRTVVLSGTVAQMSSAFAVELNIYASPRETYRGFDGPIRVPGELVSVVEGVFGLDSRQMARRASNGGPAGAVPLTPPQVASLYGFLATGGANQTVAILEFSGPTSNPNTPNCGFSTSDVTSFLSSVGVASSPTRTIQSFTVDPSPTSPGNSPFENASDFTVLNPPDPDIEVALDVEVVASVVPDADIAVYFTPATEQGWVDAIHTILADAPNNPGVLSISWGWPELEADAALNFPDPPAWPFEWSQAAATTLSAAFQSAAMVGMTVLVASGDDGTNSEENDGQAHVSYPASDPWVTACGGTAITGTSPLTQITWNDNSSANPVGGATGGGISALWAPPPPWQDAVNLPAPENPGQPQGRGLPDVAGNADPYSGYVLWLYGQSANDLIATDTGDPMGPTGGTSAVAPLYAALIAQINEALSENVGYLNPTLYAIGSTPGQDVFTDIDDGATNAVYWVNPDESLGGPSPGYTSVPGWDACTGLGVINGSNLLGALQDYLEYLVAALIPSWR